MRKCRNKRIVPSVEKAKPEGGCYTPLHRLEDRVFRNLI